MTTTSDPAPLRILVAEDNESNRWVMQLMLEHLGLQADYVADGRSAVAEWERQRYDLILMDCRMPEMDGLQAAHAIRQREAACSTAPAQRTRLVAVTADATEAAHAACLAAGMDAYLTKPIALPELYAVLTARPGSEPAPGGGSAPAADFAAARGAALVAELGADAVAEVFAAFLGDLDANLAQMRALWQAGELAPLARCARGVRSIAVPLGLERLSYQCGALDTAARAGDAQGVAVVMESIGPVGAAAAAALRKWLLVLPARR